MRFIPYRGRQNRFAALRTNAFQMKAGPPRWPIVDAPIWGRGTARDLAKVPGNKYISVRRCVSVRCDIDLDTYIFLKKRLEDTVNLVLAFLLKELTPLFLFLFSLVQVSL